MEELILRFAAFVNISHALALNGLGAFLKMIFYNLFHKPSLTNCIPGLLVVAGVLFAWLDPGSDAPLILRGCANAGLAILMYEMLRKLTRPGAPDRNGRKD